jgi:hypothetical protein
LTDTRNLFGSHFRTQIHAHLATTKLVTRGPSVILINERLVSLSHTTYSSLNFAADHLIVIVIRDKSHSTFLPLDNLDSRKEFLESKFLESNGKKVQWDFADDQIVHDIMEREFERVLCDHNRQINVFVMRYESV